MVITRYGIVATEHPIASQIGADILSQGGNASTHAVAANAAMGVFAPDGQVSAAIFRHRLRGKSGKL